MTKRESSFWGSKSQPDIPEDLMSNALAIAADLLIYTDLHGEVYDILVNPDNDTLGCLDHWIGRNIRDFLEEESIEKVDLHLEDLKTSDLGEFRVTEINHVDNAEWGFPIRYTILHDPSTERVMFVGRDLAPIAMVQQDLVRTQLALESDYESSRDFETRYRAILETVDDPLALVNIDTGRIEDINSIAAELLGEAATGLRGSGFLSRFEVNDNIKNLEAIISGTKGHLATEWQTTSKATRRRLTISVTALRSAGTRYALCRFEPEQGIMGQDTFLSDGLRMLFEDGVDAIVFTSPSGTILNCNNSFLDLCDVAAAADVINRPLADFLSRGSIDQKMLIEGGTKNGQLRSYNTKVVTNYRSTMPVNVSATKLADSKGGGFGFVIRIMRSMEQAPSNENPPLLNDNQNVAKLVGASPLKDIVAETADVIERICIETAIEMTGNNRVAAAEMLGLSRQSLYVKLRKYDMLDKSSEV